MMNVEKQIAYWRQTAQEDWAVTQELLGLNRIRHSLFFAYMTLEKILKAHVCRQTRDLAPRIHNLVRLAELAALNLSEEQLDVLAEMNAFSIEGRYPEFLTPPPILPEARAYIARAEEVLEWLTSLL